MPAREAYLVKKKFIGSQSPQGRQSPAVLKPVCSKLTFWCESPAGPEVRGPTLDRGPGIETEWPWHLKKEGYILSPPQVGFRSRVLVPRWPKRRDTLGFAQWVSRPGHEDLVSFSCELLTRQTVGGVWKSPLPRKQVPWSSHDTQPCLPPSPPKPLALSL